MTSLLSRVRDSGFARAFRGLNDESAPKTSGVFLLGLSLRERVPVDGDALPLDTFGWSGERRASRVGRAIGWPHRRSAAGARADEPEAPKTVGDGVSRSDGSGVRSCLAAGRPQVVVAARHGCAGRAVADRMTVAGWALRGTENRRSGPEAFGADSSIIYPDRAVAGSTPVRSCRRGWWDRGWSYRWVW